CEECLDPCPQHLHTHLSASPPPGFQDVHSQVLLSFGLLVAFLGRYGPGSAAISILIIAFAIQWAVLTQGFLNFFLNGKISVGAQSMVSADFCTAAVLISMGAVLGRLNPVQTLLLALLEVILCTFNEYILLSLMGVRDSGHSLTIHTFGAYFGLMVSRILYQPHKDKRKREEWQDMGAQPDVFAVVGTIYLWIFWPSVTSASTAHGDAENWAVLNTYFTLSHAVVLHGTSSPDHVLLHQVLIQDATLAGMAVMGMAGEMLVTPFGALITGFLAGLISLLGFRFFTVSQLGTAKDTDPCFGGSFMAHLHLPNPQTRSCSAASPSQHPSFPTLSPARPVLQAENPRCLWGSQQPRAARDTGVLAGDAADAAGHRRHLW
uniref:Rh family B glycoprotein n=1 Tax=Malurus cyaneus samueli TaxID=2593467 RepID=A0A8C5U1Z8_9PASS